MIPLTSIPSFWRVGNDKTIDLKTGLKWTFLILEIICASQLLYIASLFSISTDLILEYHQAASFLNSINHIPLSKTVIIFTILILFPVLLGLMKLQNQVKETRTNVFGFLVLEVLICGVLLRMISFSSNELLLLVIANMLTLTRSRGTKGMALLLLLFALILTNYNVISYLIPVAAFDNYLVIYNADAIRIFQSIKVVNSTLILIVFVVYILFLIQDQATDS